MIENREDPAIKPFFDLAMGKRPAEELYDLKTDPNQLTNVAGQDRFAEVKQELANQLTSALRETADPRVIGGGDKFDEYPYRPGGK